MAVHLRDGYYGTCTSPGSGTGAYTGVAAVAGYRSFATLTDGDLVTVAVRSATGWGEDILATKSGGATPTLTRTQILSNINSNTSPIDWPAGTPLVIWSAASGVEIASLLKQNTWQDHQNFNGKRVVLSVDANTYWYAPNNDQAYLALAGATALQSYKNTAGSNETIFQLLWNDGSAAGGPGLILQRISSSPANVDPLGYISFLGRNSAGADKAYATLYCSISDVTSGSENGAFVIDLINNGARTNAMTISPTNTLIHPGANSGSVGVLVNKGSQGIGGVGIELLSNGIISNTVSGAGTINCSMNRNADGKYFQFLVNGSEQGSIGVSGGTVSLVGGSIAHASELLQPLQDDPPYGSVMCSVDEMFDDLHPKVVMAREPADPAVYGVWQGRDEENGRARINAVGSGRIRAVGPIRHGDLLESSGIPGVARRQDGRALLSSTVAQARASVPEPGEQRLIPCTLRAG